MTGRRSTSAKFARKLSDAILASRYLDLQRLRDEVRKAEARCGRSKKVPSLGANSPLDYTASAPRSSVRPKDQKIVDFHS
jgi:hypothetical protein